MNSRKSPPFMLKDRDNRILSDIGMCGGLTAEQICLQHFNPTVIRVYNEDGSVKGLEVVIHANCQKRLKLLKDHGFTRRIELYQRLKEGKKPYFYTLTRLGAQAVAEFRECSLEETSWRERETRLRPNYIAHHIGINDIRLAVMRAVKGREDISLVRWYDEEELTKIHSKFTIPAKLGKTIDVGKLFPDACFVLCGPDNSERYHFVEYDAGTETVVGRKDLYRTFAAKMSRYVHFLFERTEDIEEESGKKRKGSLFEKAYNTPMARVLIITTSSARRTHLLAASESEEVGAQRVFWFSTHPHITKSSIQTYKKDNGEEAYRAVMLDILSDPMWLIAKDRDENRPEHALDEPFKRLLGQ